MSNGKKNNRRGRRNERSLGDVTINDFANSTVCKSRPKKSLSSVTQVVKQMVVETDNRAWDEKLDDCDGDFDFVKEENEDGTATFVIKHLETSSRRKKKLMVNSCELQTGFTYPLDIWFLISEHIDPEDVGRFGGICRSSSEVVSSAKFWFCMYKRYYKTVPNLPERLQPECMMRLYGLRSCVIRALYFMYPPFINKFKSVTTFEGDPHILTKRQCVLMWHQKCKNQWLFYFKLKKVNTMHRNRSHTPRHQPDLLEMLEDVTANHDENCRILQVTCLNYVPTPPVLGLTLASVSMTLSQGLRHHRLQLAFGSSVAVSSTNMPLEASTSSTIILDPVINVRVLDWWHPLYPHTSTSTLLCSEE